MCHPSVTFPILEDDLEGGTGRRPALSLPVIRPTAIRSYSDSISDTRSVNPHAGHDTFRHRVRKWIALVVRAGHIDL
jgi:hypothetical protein